MAVYRIHIGGGPPARPPGLLARVGLGIAAALAVISSLFLGVLIFVVIASAIVITSVVFFARAWWFKRQIEKSMKDDLPRGQPSDRRPTDPDVIDVEFTEKDA